MSEDVGFDGLFSPVALGPLTLANRIVVSPMTRVSAMENGEATPQMQRYYEQFASGGWGLIETEATYIDEEHSQCRARQPGLATTRHRDAWRLVVNAVHAHGAAIFAQLQHAGALAEARRYCADTVAPSAIEPRSRHPLPIPRELTSTGIARIHEHFARAAGLAIQAGFDGVELHGANGYLVDLFLTDYTNHRTDEYGGPIANRIRFAVEAVGPCGVSFLRTSRWVCACHRQDGGPRIHLAGRRIGRRDYFSFARRGRCVVPSRRRTERTVLHAWRMPAVRARQTRDRRRRHRQWRSRKPTRARALVASRSADLSPSRAASGEPRLAASRAEWASIEAIRSRQIRPAATLDNAEAWHDGNATLRRALQPRPSGATTSYA